jgi:hypothetical protein
MASDLKPKGYRVIDMMNIGGVVYGGLGCDLLGHDRARLLDQYGAVDSADVWKTLDDLQIGANSGDCKAICCDLDSMRITEHRPDNSFDRVMLLAAKLSIEMPVGVPEQPAAVKDLGKSFTDRQPPEGLERIQAMGTALRNLAIAANAVNELQIWLETKRDWHDDAFCLAATLGNIARRSGKQANLSFKSSKGPANCAVAHLLNLAGIRIHNSLVQPDTVRGALRAHPQAEVLGLR